MFKARLSEDEKNALKKAIKGINGDVFLFGSRVDINKKGGDIDILVLLNKSKINKFDIKLNIITKFQWFCEEKVDVVVFDKNNLKKQEQSFLNIINKISLGEILS